MKRVIRLDEDDISKIIMEHFDARPSQVTSLYIDEEDETGEIDTKFYIEVEENESK